MLDRSFYDVEGQQQRRTEALGLISEFAASYFNDEGEFIALDKITHSYHLKLQLPTREQVWYCIAFLASDNPEIIKKANTILRRLLPAIAGSFVLVGGIQLLKRYRRNLDPDIIAAFEDAIKAHCTQMLSPSIAYSGINDNFPSMDCSICLIGGEMLGHKEGYEKGVALLHQLRSMLTRRGFMSEYNSPTYTAISLETMANIYEFCSDPEIKELALQLEERIYIDMLGHYHPLVSCNAPPYSRSYMVDNCSHTHVMKYAMHVLFGDKMPLNLKNTALSGPDCAPGEEVHSGVAFMQSEIALHVCAEYHLPVYLAELALNKSFPFVMSGTTESRARRDNAPGWEHFIFPGSSSNVYTYMNTEYALGTTTKEFSSGFHTNSFGIIYRRAEVKSQADAVTVFSRFIFNESDPNKANHHGGKIPDIERESFTDCGRKLCMQKNNTAIAAYRPKHWATCGVKSMKLSLLMPIHYKLPEQVFLGEKLVDLSGDDGTKAVSENPCSVIIKDGSVFIGFRPLSLTDHGRKAAVKVEKLGNFLLFSFYNYEGEEKEFDLNEVMMTANGVLCEVRQKGEISSVDEMQSLLDSARILDEKLWFDGFDTERHLKVAAPSASFECTWCPETESVKYMLVDGEIAETPILSVPGLNIKDIPFYTPSWEKIRNL